MMPSSSSGASQSRQTCSSGLLNSDKDFTSNSAAPSCNLWQLREQDPLETWTKGRVILIGDAAHAMLPRKRSLCP